MREGDSITTRMGRTTASCTLRCNTVPLHALMCSCDKQGHSSHGKYSCLGYSFRYSACMRASELSNWLLLQGMAQCSGMKGLPARCAM